MGEMSGTQDSGAGREGRRLGELLERRRLEKGLSLREVEEATKIRTRYLQGLEREDYTVLPDAVYVRGFLKTYADFLGLDGEALAHEMKELRAPRRERQAEGYVRGAGGRGRDSDFERPIIQPGGLAGTERRRISGATIATVLVVLLVLAVVIGALYRVGQGAGGGSERNVPEGEAAASREPAPGENGSGDAATTAPAEEPSTTGAASPSGPGTTGGATDVDPGQIRAVVRVTEDGPSWIQVSTDGEVAYEQIAPVGFERAFRAEELFAVSTGNAGGVEVEVNGQSVGELGQYGEVVRREFPLMPPSE